MEEETKQLLKNDELPGSFKQEDASMSSVVSAVANFEEGWILRKYKGELKDRNSAAFVYLIQHIFALVWKMYSGPATIQLPPDNNTFNLLKRDIELLKHILQKDHPTTMMFLILFFDKLQQDVSHPTKPDLNTASELRKYLGAQLDELLKHFTTKLDEYNRLRSSILGEATEQRLHVLNYVNGNHSVESMRLLYPELILPTTWLKPTQLFEERPIEEFLIQEKDKNNAQAAFVLDLLSKRNYLDKIRPILLSIMKFSSLLGKRYDKRFSREESVAFQDSQTKPSSGNMMADDDDEDQDLEETSGTTYKLNLASILDNSYFTGSRATAQQPTKTVKISKRKSNQMAQADEEEEQSNYQPEDIKKEFTVFREMVKKQLIPLIASTRDDFENRLKVGCEGAASVIRALENLGNPRLSPLVGYCFPNTTGLDDIDQPLVSLKTLVEGLLSVQLDLIAGYRENPSIVPFMPALPQMPRKFLDCSEEHFIYLDPKRMLDDLKAAAYCEMHSGTNTTRIAVDTQIVAKKWADIMFSEAERISVTCNLNFVDQSDNNLLDLCQRLTKERGIEMETNLQELIDWPILMVETKTNMEQVAYADGHIQGNEELDLEKVLLLGLEYVLTHDKQNLKGETTLFGLLPQDLRYVVSPKLLKQVKLRHCELLRSKILIFGYPNASVDQFVPFCVWLGRQSLQNYSC